MLLFSPAAFADEPTRLGLSAGTDFPMSLGVRGGLELPFRLRISTSLGLLPKPYVKVIDGFLRGISAYDDATGDLVVSSLQSSLIWRTHAGYRPFPKLGLYGDVGYGLVTLGGGATTAELVSALAKVEIPAADRGAGSRTLTAKSSLHMVDVEIGWEQVFESGLFLRGALGGAFTFAASTSIEPDFQPRAPQLFGRLTSAGETYLDDVYTSYVFVPVLTLGAGYLFSL